ncbi:MAG: hypothetical protein FJX76_15865 [Armatimonadetes bacterium]|nr:hypothetical protein [Armatimonadota bacterium]
MLESGVRLAYQFQPGQELIYRATTQVNQNVSDAGRILGNQKSSWESVVTMRTLTVDSDGTGHVVLITVPTREQPQGHPLGHPLTRQVLYMRMEPNGRPLDVAGAYPPAVYCFPDAPVMSGGTWNTDSQVPFPMLGQNITLVNTYRVQGRAIAAGYNCVHVEIASDENNFDAPLPDGSQIVKVQTSTKGSLYFAADEGFVASLRVETHSAPRIGTALYETVTVYEQELTQVRQVQ